MKKFPLIFIILYIPAILAQVSEPSPIGYDTVDEAFRALEADPTAGMKEYEGWVIFTQKDKGIYILWSFTPENHPAHPSAIRREVVKKGDEIFIKMDALCHSNKLDCDQLIKQFELINERIKQNQPQD